VKIREILVQTQRSQRYSFGADRHKIPFDRVNGDTYVRGYRLFCIECTSICERACYLSPICEKDGARALFVAGVCSGLSSCSLVYNQRDWAVMPAGARFLRNKRANF
jgi:hypothetical protein